MLYVSNATPIDKLRHEGRPEELQNHAYQSVRETEGTCGKPPFCVCTFPSKFRGGVRWLLLYLAKVSRAGYKRMKDLKSQGNV